MNSASLVTLDSAETLDSKTIVNNYWWVIVIIAILAYAAYAAFCTARGGHFTGAVELGKGWTGVKVAIECQ